MILGKHAIKSGELSGYASPLLQTDLYFRKLFVEVWCRACNRCFIDIGLSILILNIVIKGTLFEGELKPYY